MENYFETIKCNDNEIYNLNYHEKRIANTIGKNISLQDYIYPLSDKFLKCKIIYNQDEILDVEFSVYKKREIKNFKIIYDDQIEYKYKSINRALINNLFNQRENTDEIIIIKNNLITDTSIANIAILLNNIWLTPKLPLLNGTTRQRYINEGKLIEQDITIEMLKKAQKFALLNAMIDFDVIEEFKFLI